MPKEIIPPSTPNDAYVMAVRWGADRGVQVGVETIDGKTLAWTLYGGEAANIAATVRMAMLHTANMDDAEYGRVILNAIDQCCQFRSVWADIDRNGCNNAVRYIRRARDAAFGRDE